MKLEEKLTNRRRFVGKVLGGLVGGGIGLGSLEEARGDDSDILYTMGAILRSGVVPTKNCKDAMFLRRLGEMNMRLAMYDKHRGSLRTDSKIRPLNPKAWGYWGPSALFYVCNTWEDSNRNGKTDMPEEFTGFNKRTFIAGEEMHFYMDTRDLNGSNAYVHLFNPQGRNFETFSQHISKNSWNWWKRIRNETESAVKKYGEGTYFAKFDIGNECIGLRFFELKSNVHFYVGNYWKDFDEDGGRDFPEEIVGKGKTEFRRNEPITFALTARNSKGQIGKIRLFNPRGGEVFQEQRIFPYDNSNWSMEKDVGRIVENYGGGTYKAVFYVNGEYVGGKEFEMLR